MKCPGRPLGHESLLPKAGSPTQLLRQYMPECPEEQKHFGCPHAFDLDAKYRTLLYNLLIKVINTQKNPHDPEELKERLLRHRRKLQRVDKDMRFQRTGTMHSSGLATKKIPNAQKALQNGIATEEHYENYLLTVEDLRCELLELCRAALQRDTEEI